uniref:Uncharacterized protein n=1 Tax=Falco tinnunculus TaxID=100819 RepID=A0A8C4TZV2_FALTI
RSPQRGTRGRGRRRLPCLSAAPAAGGRRGGVRGARSPGQPRARPAGAARGHGSPPPAPGEAAAPR